jgi:general secretion pathway protein N
MSNLGRAGIVGCLLLGASSCVIAVAATGSSDPAEFGTVETTRPIMPSPQNQPAIEIKPAPSGNPLWAIPIKLLRATRDRPIFSQSRRPRPTAGPVAAAVNSAAPKPKEPDRLQLALLGTIVNGEDGFGIFMEPTTKAAFRIRIGAAYKGWTLRQIQPRSVTFKKDFEAVMLAFPKPAGDDKSGGRAIAVPAAKQPLLPPRLGFTAPLSNPPPETTSLQTAPRSFGKPGPPADR